MQEEINNQIEEDLEFDEDNPFTMPEVTDEEVKRLGNYYLSGEYLIRNARNNPRKEERSISRGCSRAKQQKRKYWKEWLKCK